MKIQIEELPRLTVADVTCAGCGMSALLNTQRLCEFCRNVVKQERRVSWLERLFPDRYFSTQVIVAAIVLIAIFVFVFNSWN
jgi:hypothetical protein